MQATFLPPSSSNPYRDRIIPESWDKLELVDGWTLLAFRDGSFEHLATVRWKRPRSGDGASPMRCAVFFLGMNPYRVGYAKAGGYGYCKRSQAFESACRSAGVTFDQLVGGVGESAVRDALLALGRTIVGDTVPLTVVEA